jgi:hypothetical protein
MGNSDFLFARPSFLEGAARVIDASGSLNVYNSMPTGEEADALATWADWSAVGGDIMAAAENFNGRLRLELSGVEKK